MRICGVGWRADIALRDGSGDARVLAALSASIYVEAANELLWIGASDATPHARALHVTDAVAHASRVEAGDRLRRPASPRCARAPRVSRRSPRQSLVLRAASVRG